MAVWKTDQTVTNKDGSIERHSGQIESVDELVDLAEENLGIELSGSGT